MTMKRSFAGAARVLLIDSVRRVSPVGIAGWLLALTAINGQAVAATYTLSKTVQEAIAHSDKVAGLEAKIDGAEAKADEMLYAMLPQLQFAGGWVHLDTAPYVETEIDPTTLLPKELLTNPTLGPYFSDLEPVQMRIEMGRQNMFQFQMQAQQILFAGGALYRQREMALAQLRSAREEERGARHDVAKQAEELFWKLALAKEGAKVTDEAIATTEAYVKMLEAVQRTGLATEADVMTARVQLSNLRFTSLQVKQNIALAEAGFRVLLDLPGDEPIELDVTTDGLPFTLDPDIDKLIEAAKQHRPELKMLAHQYDATTQGAKAAWATWLPAVAVMGDVYLKNPDRANEPNWYWSGDVQLGLQWNLWDRGQALTRTRQAQAGLKQVEAARSQVIDGIHMELEQAASNYVQAKEQATVAAETVALAEKTLRLQQANFQSGVAKNLDVLQAQTNLSRAKLDALDVQTDLKLAEAALRRAVGIDVEGSQP